MNGWFEQARAASGFEGPRIERLEHGAPRPVRALPCFPPR